jgi:hypothetical protein
VPTHQFQCVLSLIRRHLFAARDDFGWHNIGWRNSEIRSPVLDALAADGIKLNRHCALHRRAALGARAAAAAMAAAWLLLPPACRNSAALGDAERACLQIRSSTARRHALPC